MGTSLFIENINNKRCLTVNEILKIGQTISQFDVSEDDEEYDEFLNAGLDEIEFILLGQNGISARGFEFSFDTENNSYCIRIFSPYSIGDFSVLFNFIHNLGNYLGSPVVITDYGEEFSVNNIEEFPYYDYIMFGLENTMEVFKKSEQHILEIYGLNRPVSFNKEIFSEIMESNNPVEKFSNFITEIQYIDAFSANQALYQDKDGSFLGVYTLTETVRIILPYKPSLEYKYANILGNDDVIRWEIHFVGIDGDADDFSSYHKLGKLEYSDFIKKLPEEKYSFIDASYILVEPLNRNDIEKLLI